jgi:chaperone required for assembly of F1-ATPase
VTNSSAAHRFYSAADIRKVDDGFALTLDGRDARSPGGRTLVLPTQALARLVADEWRAQGERIELAAMPATALTFVALDAAPASHGAAAEALTDFAAHDLLCYFAPGPRALRERQEAVWSPLLEWARASFGLAFVRTAGVTHVDQPPATLAGVREMAGANDDFVQAGLAAAARLYGSAILALALARGRLSGPEALAAARLDETFQAEQWGEDLEAAAVARGMAREADMLEAWFAALGKLVRLQRRG